MCATINMKTMWFSLELMRAAIHFNLTTITCTLRAVAYVFEFLENRYRSSHELEKKIHSLSQYTTIEEQTNK